MTVSIGVAHWDGQESADALVARADAALDGAKATGRPLRGRELSARAADAKVMPTRQATGPRCA
jgi:GGDEF domain-containing protein